MICLLSHLFVQIKAKYERLNFVRFQKKWQCQLNLYLHQSKSYIYGLQWIAYAKLYN